MTMKMKTKEILFMDFETKSDVDLKKAGAHKYARDPSTRPLLLSWAFDNEPVKVHEFWWLQPIPERIIEHIKAGGIVVAWNIAFDRLIWNTAAGLPTIEIDQCVDAMAMASAMGWPRGMGKCAEAMMVQYQKHTGGSLLSMFCGKKHHDHTHIHWSEFVEYARRDTETLRSVFNNLHTLSDTELENMRADMYINEAGIPLDMKALAAAEKRVEELVNENAFVCRAITGFNPTQVGELKKWVQKKLAANYYYNSMPLTDFSAATVQNILDSDDIPSDVRTVLECRQLAGKTSVSKLKAMRAAQIDGRVHGCLAYHAATTGRAGGRIIQPQNMPRPHIKQDEIEKVIKSMFKTATMPELSSCLRGIIAAKRLVGADLSNIEGRVLAWLAGEHWKVKAFYEIDAGHGDDMYLQAASRIYDIPIADLHDGARLVGKTAELACGYQGGDNAMASMENTLRIPEDKRIPVAQRTGIIDSWRDAHPATRKLWKRMESKAKLVVRYGKPMKVNDYISFRMEGKHLMMTLPSGRELCYPNARMEKVMQPWGERSAITFDGKDTYTNKWCRCSTYSGKLTENAVQAIARDVLYDAIRAARADGHKIVLHVHDEIVVESDTLTVEQLCDYMTAPLPWATGLPLAAEGWEGMRFRK